MKKRIICSILMVLLVFTLCCGCQKSESKDNSSNKQASNNDNQSKQNNDNDSKNTVENKDVEALKAVLEGKDTFYDTDNKKDIKVTEINDFQGIHVDEALKGAHFAIMNLDGDSKPEVVIELSTGSDESLGFEILRYADEKVYGYSIGYRAFNQIKADGTFNYADSAASYGYGKLKFSTDSYETDTLAYTDVDDNSGSVEYFIGSDSVAQDKFREYEDEQTKKEDPYWYEFTDENFTASFEKFSM